MFNKHSKSMSSFGSRVRLAGLSMTVVLGFQAMLSAQIIIIQKPGWDRSIEDILIRPGIGSAAGKFAIEAKYRFWAAHLNSNLNLSAVARLFINHELKAERLLEVHASAGDGGGCGAACAEFGKPCICYPDLNMCDCGELFFSVPEFFELEAGDVITIILVPAPGAAEEDNEANNRRSLEIESLPTWNRKVEDLSVRPASGGGTDVLEIEATVSIAAEGFADGALPLDFDTTAILFHNHQPLEDFPIQAVVGPQLTCEAQCQQSHGQHCVCIEHIGCGCGELKIVIRTVQTINLQPGDEITVLLRTGARSVPEYEVKDDRKTFTYNPRPLTPVFKRGDVTVNGDVDLTDSIVLLESLFLGKREILCEDAADANDDGNLDVTDPIVILDQLFVGSLEIAHPGFLECGEDKTPDHLTCEEYRGCLIVK